MSERRRFSRVIYNVPAKLQQGELGTTGAIMDLSLHGVLLTAPSVAWDCTQLVNVSFHIPESDIDINLQVEIVELTDTRLRTSIKYIDIDSIGYLKRLVELNVGDDELLHREIEQLSDLGEYH
jgi:hypothetical protein